MQNNGAIFPKMIPKAKPSGVKKAALPTNALEAEVRY